MTAETIQALRAQSETVTRAAMYFRAVGPPGPQWAAAFAALDAADIALRSAVEVAVAA